MVITAIASIKQYIYSYYKQSFNKNYLLAVMLMLAVIISINYGYSFPAIKNKPISFVLDYGLYFLPFAIAWLLQWFYFKEDRSYFSQPWFWLLLFTAPLIFTFRIQFNFQEDFVKRLSSTDDFKFVSAVINYFLRVLLLILPVIFIWYIKDRKSYGLYGLKAQKNMRIYFWMLACMLPLIFIAAILPDFLAAYPKAMRAAGLEVPIDAFKLILFELAYGFDFLSIEFFFRGFLIIAFIKYGGMRAIVPAACFYCCIHLGKPMAEAISSFFGGLLLGIISYHTLSIWGGLLVHLGIAWLMELAAYISHQF